MRRQCALRLQLPARRHLLRWPTRPGRATAIHLYQQAYPTTPTLHPFQLHPNLSSQVIAVDGVPSRRQLAERFGAAAVEPAAAADAVQSATSGRGADVVLEVVGSNPALQLALELLRPGGTLSSVGVHTEASFPFSPVDGYNKNLTYRCVGMGAGKHGLRGWELMRAC